MPWLRSLPQSLKGNKLDHYYKDLLNYFLPQVIEFLFGKDKSLEEEMRTQ